MGTADTMRDLSELVEKLNFKEKVERSLALIREAYRQYGDFLVAANSLGKDSMVVWDLAKKVNPRMRGFIVTTRFKPKETIAFMKEIVSDYPELTVYKNDVEIDPELYKSDPDKCCALLKVIPVRQAISQLGARCWMTGLRCTEGRTRVGLRESEEGEAGAVKLNPILIWTEREVWQYLALYGVKVNRLYAEGYRSLGCAPCTTISTGPEERSGRWRGTAKCGGECGIHARSVKVKRAVNGTISR